MIRSIAVVVVVALAAVAVHNRLNLNCNFIYLKIWKHVDCFVQSDWRILDNLVSFVYYFHTANHKRRLTLSDMSVASNYKCTQCWKICTTNNNNFVLLHLPCWQWIIIFVMFSAFLPEIFFHSQNFQLKTTMFVLHLNILCISCLFLFSYFSDVSLKLCRCE